MPKNKKARLFIAIELPERIHQVLQQLQSQLKHPTSSVKWSNPKNTHLTLKFLADTPVDKIPDIKDILTSAFSNLDSFNLSLENKIEAFPSIKRPRVLWIGIKEGADIVKKIQKQLEENLARLGFNKEKRKFTPHLTLGRTKYLKSKEEYIESIKKVSLEEQVFFTADKIILYQSTLTEKGPVYCCLHTINLS
jgi:2'-5' RNA ligase